jgi:hypothetical protein
MYMRKKFKLEFKIAKKFQFLLTDDIYNWDNCHITYLLWS